MLRSDYHLFNCTIVLTISCGIHVYGVYGLTFVLGLSIVSSYVVSGRGLIIVRFQSIVCFVGGALIVHRIHSKCSRGLLVPNH